MVVLDLFCGTKSIAKAFEAAGHTVYTVDWDKKFNPTLAADIGELLPISEYARRCDEINAHLIALIAELKPRYWFIENPVACMRKMWFMRGLPRYTLTYCQYGERRQKPTDIWTNHPNPGFKPPCKRGSPCHEAAPRGSGAGTEGLKNKVEKARIPVQLCEHIVEICGGGAGNG